MLVSSDAHRIWPSAASKLQKDTWYYSGLQPLYTTSYLIPAMPLPHSAWMVINSYGVTSSLHITYLCLLALGLPWHEGKRQPCSLPSHIHTPLEAQTSKCPEDHPPPRQEKCWWTNTLFLCAVEFSVLRPFEAPPKALVGWESDAHHGGQFQSTRTCGLSFQCCFLL